MLPELQDFRWYIDMKLIPAANGQRIQQPSCVLSLDVSLIGEFHSDHDEYIHLLGA